MPPRASEKAVATPRLPERLVIARHLWTTAETALKRSKASFLATATEDARAVIVETTEKGSKTLERYALDPAAMLAEALEPGTPPPEKPKPVDPFDAAFARAREQRKREKRAA